MNLRTFYVEDEGMLVLLDRDTREVRVHFITRDAMKRLVQEMAEPDKYELRAVS